MRSRELGFLGCALCAGCASGADEAVPYVPRDLVWGGQTGSLVPKCGAALEASIPEGSSGIVVDARACPRPPGASDVELENEAGESIAAEWIPLGDGRYLVKPSQSLEQGNYGLTIAGREERVQVGEAAPEPEILGELEELASGSCGLNLVLRLDPSVLPYAPLLNLRLLVDGELRLQSDFGELNPEDATLGISCDACLGSGVHELEVVGEIAGSQRVLQTDPLTVEASCPAGDDSGPACSAGRGPRPGAGAAWAGVSIGLLALLRRATSKRTGGS